jgi:LemA protein
MYAILAIVLVVIVFGIYLYNGLVRLKNKVKEAWADIETQLKRRYDLIPNIVQTVKGYAKHEEGTFVKVTEMRAKAMESKNLGEKAEAENMLSETLKSLFAISENYPELKANKNFLDLQNTLKEIEEHVQLSRRYYNGTVRDFNTKIEVFPNNLIANPLGFKAKEFFETKNEQEKENVAVDFSADVEAPAETSSEAPAEDKPTEPEAPAPETPVEAPAEPETPAEEPVVETPVVEPEAPVEEPVVETPAEPETPEVPETPAEEPVVETPVVEPEAPVEEPVVETPVVEPEAPVEEPIVEETPAEPETPAEEPVVEAPAEPETPAEEPKPEV